MNIKIEEKQIFFIGRNKEVHVEKNSGRFSFFKRFLNSKLRIKNYDILEILKLASCKKSLSDRHIKEIYEKCGKKLKIESIVIDILLQAGSNEAKADFISNICLSRKDQISKLKTLQSHLDPASPSYQMIEQVSKEVYLKNKLKEIKQDPALANKYPADIDFLFKTRLMYSMVGYQNTTEAGRKEHAFHEGRDLEGNPCLLIKKQGEWVPISSIQKEFDWNTEEFTLTSKTNPNERWNYFHEGLVPIDRFYHHSEVNETGHSTVSQSLHPVTKLSQEEMNELLNHAKAFETSLTDHQIPKDCVVQFVTNPRPGLENIWLTKNLTSKSGVHCGIRIIQKDGTVYSTGFGSAPEEYKYRKAWYNTLTTINGQPTIMDQEEFRSHQGRIVTSIPISSAQAEDILKTLNDYRKNSIRFNIIKQNCMKLGTSVLEMAGVHLDTRTSYLKMMIGLMPSLRYVPVVGKPLDYLKKGVKNITQSMGRKTPQCIKNAFHLLSQLVLYVPYKIETVLTNLLFIAHGGYRASPELNNQQDHSTLNEGTTEQKKIQLKSFTRLVSGLFDDEAKTIYHSSKFIQWQLQQKSTAVYAYTGQPNMHITPPKSDEEKEYSKEKQQELIEIYR